MSKNIPQLLEQLTLEEKAGLCSGHGHWWTKAVERLGLPPIMMSDGPHGLRTQKQEGDHLGLHQSIEAVCFPTGVAIAAGFSRELARLLGQSLGEEADAEGVHTVLGPAVNIKRSPLCGRNFEYLSEDPLLAGELASAYVSGIQDTGTGACVKHFAANNQEFRRMSTDTVVSERALRELYLPAFETVVKKSRPWSFMCAYNRLNGVYCCEHEWLLKTVLREQWGFDGIVMTDWGAMNNRVSAIKAGLNLEMPSSHGYYDREIVKAVESGELSLDELDHSVEELLHWIFKGRTEETSDFAYDKNSHHERVRKMAAECAVLLKNDKDVLPLEKGSDVAFIGTFAEGPRYQGGGSSHINAFKVTSAVDAATNIKGVSYEPGWSDDGVSEDGARFESALAAAKKASAAVIFAGLPESFESEGYDRTHLRLPDCQNRLISAICAAQPNTVVVLHMGAPVVMPWNESVPAILNMYLGGQAVGGAAVDLIFGDASPSGRLPETFPLSLEDTPCYLNFPGNGERVVYAEDVFVGYRWYDSLDKNVLYPFGHGLSYTQFEFSDLRLSAEGFGGGTMEVLADVKNIGIRSGAAVAQLYVAPPKAGAERRPSHELKGFEKVLLQPGEAKTVSFTLDKRSFAYFEERIGDWRLESGSYEIQVGASSRDLPLRTQLNVTGSDLPFVFTEQTTIADVLRAGKEKALESLIMQLAQAFGGDSMDDSAINPEMMASMLEGLPIHSLVSFLPLENGFLDEIKRTMETLE